MNTGPHANPAMLAAFQRQQQQQQQQHSQMNPAMMNGMGNMSPTQQQQLQQMLAAKYQGAGMNMGGGGNFNPQMMQQLQQQQQQHQGGAGGGSMGMNPQALMNMGGMGMNGRSSIGSGDGFNPQMFQQQQQQQYNRPGGGVNPQMLSGMNATQIASGSMNGMSNNMMGMGGGMGGMGMGMGGGMNNGGMSGMGINPQTLSMGASGSQNPSASSPTQQPQSINPAALNVSSNMGMGGGINNNMGGIQGMNGLPMNPQQISQMSPQDRQRLMKMMYAQQQQQQMRQRAASAGAGMNAGDDGSMGVHGGMSNMNSMGAMGGGMSGMGTGMGGMGMRGGDQSMGMGMDGMMGGMPSNFNGGMGGMNNNTMMSMGGMGGAGSSMGMGMGNAGGMQGMTPAQLAQMQQLQAQHSQGQGQDRPASSMSMAQNQPGGPQGQGHMQQHQQHQNAGAGMMRPPSSIPPRPPTTASSPSPAPRPGTGSGMHGMMGPPSLNAHMPMGMQQQQGQQYQLAQANSPRPGTAGGTPAAASPGASAMPMSRAGSSMGMHQAQQNAQQQQQLNLQQAGQNQQQQNQAAPVPIQPRPRQAGTPTGTSPAPTPRPSTSQSMHGLRAITPALVGSRPGTASGFRQQQQHPSQSGAPNQPGAQHGAEQVQQQQQNQQQHTPLTTPTSATYPPIAPAPTNAAAGTPGPGSPKGVKRRISGTPVPGVSASTPGAVPQGPGQHPQNVGPNNMQMQSGMPGGNMNTSGANSLMNAGGMGPPSMHRGQPNQLPGGDIAIPGMNGVPNINGMPSLSRQASLGPPVSGVPNAAGLSINTNMNPTLAAAAMGPMNAMGTPTATASPNPAMLADGLSGAPATPNRQTSLPPTAGSPFPAGGMMGMPGTERKISGQGLLSGVTPLSRSSSDVFGATTPAVTASAAAAAVPTPPSTSAPATAPAANTQIVPALPPLPANVKLNPHVSRVTIVPLIDSETTIRALKQEEIEMVQGWMKSDKEYEALHQKMRERMAEEVKDVVAKHRAWWERDPQNPQDDPRVPKRQKAKLDLLGLKNVNDRVRKKVGKREGFKLPRTVNPQDANKPEQLVPIRLEFDVEHHKMRDTFVWNLNDPIITPEIFAQTIVDDYSLTPNYHSVITKAIQEQLSDFKAHFTTFGEDGITLDSDDVVLKGEVNDEDAAWWEAWRDRVRSDAYLKRADTGDARSRKRRKIVKDEPEEPKQLTIAPALDHAMSVDEFEEDENKLIEEMRILVKLDIVVGFVKLEDQIEWDLDSPDPSPELFAEVYAKELGLGGEFKTAIAHSIREQVQIYQKSLFLVGHPSDGSAVQDEDLRLSMLPSLNTGARSMDQVMAFTPQLNYLSDSELERNEKEREKELNRRRRKTTRGRRGIAMPDREPPKTFRTPAIGFPEVDAQTLALASAAAAPTARRAAAAAASLTIANMVASENGTSLMPQAMPAPVVQAAAPPPPKEKKPKGLMKPPSYPASVLRPRANVKAPTPSTAADASTVPPPIEDDPPVETNAPENRGARVPISTKKAKELEREAKEREYIDGQHANYIDGVWHCSNCGCPESIAVGRRKGPLGDKSQCGVCGKFWHRHRRPRPVEYNSSLEYHMGLKQAEEEARVAALRRKRSHAHHHEASSSKAPTIEPETPRKQPSPEPRPDESASTARLDPPVSPMSSTSSISEPPSAHAAKANGTEHTSASVAARSEGGDDAEAKRDTPNPRDGTPATPASAPNGNKRKPLVPWLKKAMEELQERYPDDKFDAISRKGKEPGQTEWRLRCSDCPGKLYTAGPGETLTNYEVHLKNRQHRQKVNLRVNGGGQS